jgi:hypothetical protein
VWLSLASITDVVVLSEIDPMPATLTTDAQDNDHIARVWGAFYAGDFKERDAVALAEAGLIRYFQPEYNDRLKHTFPARTHVPLTAVRAIDLHGLVVELHTTDVFSAFGSGVQPPLTLHFAGYAIHADPARADTLALKATSRLPGVVPGSWRD